MKTINTIISFFEPSEDDDVSIYWFTKLTGVWIFLNFFLQLPLYTSLWNSNDLVLSRDSHGYYLPTILNLLDHAPYLTHFAFFGVLFCSLFMLKGHAHIGIRCLTWYLVWLLDAKAWTVQDGGNNLIHLTLLYSILFGYRSDNLDFQCFVRKLGLRAIQLQIIVLYASAFSSKISGELWLNGTAMYYIAQIDKFQSPMLMFLFNKLPITLPTLVYGTMIIQLLLATTLYIKRIRIVSILLGVIIHLGIAFSMGLVAFSLVMIIHYSVFITKKELSWAKGILTCQKFLPRLILLTMFLVTVTSYKLYASTNFSSDFMSRDKLEMIMNNIKADSKIFVYQSRSAISLSISQDAIHEIDEGQLGFVELELGSITKLITAVRFMKSEQYGYASRNDRVKLNKDKSVRLNDLLFHVSGLIDTGPYTYALSTEKTFQYSNANYALVGQYLNDRHDYFKIFNSTFYPMQNSKISFIAASKRPKINKFYQSSWGMISNPIELRKLLQSSLIRQLPCRADGICWGGYKSGGNFSTLGKLASGSTFATIDINGHVTILSTNDSTINLKALYDLMFENS